jgi:hypothetical protein
MTADARLSAGTFYLLYFMGGFPVTIWTGRAAYAATLDAEGARPGRAMTFFFVPLPILFVLYYVWSSAGTPGTAAPGAFDR